jgi:Domain of unknown function (DUF4440)
MIAMLRLAAPLGLAVLLAASAAYGAPACAPQGSGPAMQAAVQAWFEAARRDDVAGEAALQAPGFYAYDNGKRYEGTSLGELVKSAHAAGARIEWNLHDFDVHVGCDKAWIAWINTGASGKAGAMQPVTWLESAVFGWRGGAWRMEFLHSARVPPPA